MLAKRVILLAELFVSQTQGGPFRFASEQWYSKPGDSVGVLEFSGRIVGDPTFQQRAGCAIWGGQSSSVSIGALDLANTDGGVTALRNADTRGSICVLRLVNEGEGYDQSVVVARCDIASIEQNQETVRVVLSAIDARLNRPMQTTMFPDDAPNEAVRGTPQPISMGKCLQVEPAMFAAGFDSGTYITHAATPTNTSLSLPGAIVAGTNTSEWTMTYNPGPRTVNGQIAWGWGTTAPGTYSYPSPPTMLTDYSGIFALIPEEALITGIEVHAEVASSITDPAQDDGAAWSATVSAKLLGLSGASATRSKAMAAPGTGVATVILGGANDKFDYAHISRQNIANTGFGVELTFTPSITLGSISSYKIYRQYLTQAVRVKVFYALSSADYRVSDGYVEQVIDVYAGGSIARPPSHVQPQWQYNPQRSGFEMLIQPATRVTADIVGPLSRASDLLSGDGKFFEHIRWGVTPVGWTVDAGSVAEDRDFGMRMSWPDAGSSDVRYLSDVIQAPGWHIVSGVIPELTLDAQVVIDLAGRGSATIAQPGEFCIAVHVEPGADGPVSIVGSTIATGGGIAVVRSLYVYNMDSPGNGWWTEIAQMIMDRCGVTDEYTDPFTMIPPALAGHVNPFDVVGIYSGDSMTGRAALDLIVSGYAGWAHVTPAGQARIGALHGPAGTPAITISTLNLASYPTWAPDLAPGMSSVFGGQVVWSPYSQQELAGITYEDQAPFMADMRVKLEGVSPLHRSYRDRVGAPAYPTVFDDAAVVQEQADRVTGLYSQQRGFWSCVVILDAPQQAAQITLGTHVRLSDPDVFGPGDIDGIVVGVDGQYRNNTVALTIWS